MLVLPANLASQTQQSLPFQEIRHDKPTVRVQPSVTDGFVLVMITGHFTVRSPSPYSQVT